MVRQVLCFQTHSGTLITQYPLILVNYKATMCADMGKDQKYPITKYSYVEMSKFFQGMSYPVKAIIYGNSVDIFDFYFADLLVHIFMVWFVLLIQNIHISPTKLSANKVCWLTPFLMSECRHSHTPRRET